MCYLRLQTNLPVTRAAETTLVNEATALLVRELAHAPADVVVAIEPAARLFLGGRDDPAAYVELKSRYLPAHGSLIADAITEIVHQHLGVPETRVAVKFIASAEAGVAIESPS
jgi:phenylpyruvate tautomerase PptA (4-oxalocrotonate tautomerase family)